LIHCWILWKETSQKKHGHKYTQFGILTCMPMAFIGELLLQYSYAALIPASLFVQPATALLAGVFVRLGYLVFPVAYTFIVTGALIGDVIWYWVGYHYGERFVHRFGKHFGITDEQIEKTKKIFHKHQSRILFLSKVTNGLGFAIVTLFTAGLSRVPFTRYLLFNIAGEAVWTGSLMLVGLLFSHLYIQVGGVIEKISIIAIFVIGVLIFIGLVRLVRSRFIGENV